MTPSAAQRKPKKKGAPTMSRQESAWLAWYMCALTLVLTAFGFLFLVASQSRVGAPVYDYLLLNTVIAVSFSPVGALVAPRLQPMGFPGGRRGATSAPTGEKLTAITVFSSK